MGSIYDDLWRRRRSLMAPSPERDTTIEESLPPQRFHMNELSFVRPNGLKDKTLHMLTLNEDGPSSFNLVIARSALGEQDTLDSVSSRVVSEYEKAMTEPTVIEPLQECIIADTHARRMTYRWRQHDALLTQRHYLMVVNDEHGARRLLQFTATSNNLNGFSSNDIAIL